MQMLLFVYGMAYLISVYRYSQYDLTIPIYFFESFEALWGKTCVLLACAFLALFEGLDTTFFVRPKLDHRTSGVFSHLVVKGKDSVYFKSSASPKTTDIILVRLARSSQSINLGKHTPQKLWKTNPLRWLPRSTNSRLMYQCPRSATSLA